MLYVYEIEIFESEGWLIACPYDFEGATQGANESEVAEMIADWLKSDLEHRLMHGIDIPEASFGNGPRHGGRVLLVAVEASLDTVDAIPAYKAAEKLGVSRGRVTQMVSAGLLDGFRKGRDAFVTLASIDARLEEAPKAGRPRKKAVML